MTSQVTTKSVEKTVTVKEKVITLKMTEREAEILYHLMGNLKISDFLKMAPKKLNLPHNMVGSDPDAINFGIYQALAPHFDKFYGEY